MTVYICGLYKFPKGSAGSVYVQNLAKAFAKIGYSVVLITDANKDVDMDVYLREHTLDNIKLDEVQVPSGKLERTRFYYWDAGKVFQDKLELYSFEQDDVIVTYSAFSRLNISLLKFAHSKGIKIVACVVEWMTHKQSKYGFFDFKYWDYIYNFYRVFPGFDGILAISELLHNHFDKIGVLSFTLPIMSDPFEYPYEEKKPDEKRLFIYPANGLMKDSIDIVLKAFVSLNYRDLEGVELHLTGVTMDTVRRVLDSNEYSRIENVIVLHGWMKYDDLVALYNKVCFLIISRGVSRMTLANFPSKVPETMNYGVIPVVTRVGDYTSLYLNEHNSIIFDENTVESCARAIKKAIGLNKDEISAMSKRARETSEIKFNYLTWTNKLLVFFDELREK